MGLRLINSSQGYSVSVIYSLSAIRYPDSYAPPSGGPFIGPYDFPDDKVWYQGGIWYHYSADIGSGNGIAGSQLGFYAPLHDPMIVTQIFCPLGAFRYYEADRAPWGSTQVNSAWANFSVGNMRKVTRSITWLAGDTGRFPSGTDTGDVITTTGVNMSVALNGIKARGADGALELRQLNFIGDFAAMDANKTRKFNVTQYVKAYLDNRNGYDTFGLSVFPAGLVSEPLPADPVASLLALQSATSTDGVVYTENPPASGSYDGAGTMTAQYVDWDSISLGSEIVNFDLSGWTMNANSRVGPGIGSSGV